MSFLHSGHENLSVFFVMIDCYLLFNSDEPPYIAFESSHHLLPSVRTWRKRPPFCGGFFAFRAKAHWQPPQSTWFEMVSFNANCTLWAKTDFNFHIEHFYWIMQWNLGPIQTIGSRNMTFAANGVGLMIWVTSHGMALKRSDLPNRSGLSNSSGQSGLISPFQT